MVQLVGILNLTPDSFSDGGKHHSVDAALAHAKSLIDAGATVIDIGAESTRPGATPLNDSEEWQRLEPVLQQLTTFPVTLSLDTYHPATVEKALNLGVHWINDVTGFTNPQMIDAVKASSAKLVFMHNLGIPVDKNKIIPPEKDVVQEIFHWGEAQINRLEQAGIAKDRLIFDPGIGFGKNAAQSLHLLKDIAAFHQLDVPLFVGHSRKSCFSALTQSQSAERDPETFAAGIYLAQQGVQYLRVHNVAGQANALALANYLWEKSNG